MSAKNLDSHGRYRSQTIGFRASPEEEKQINIAVSLSGMTKQDFIVSKLLDRTIYVKTSCKVHRAVYDQLTSLLEQLKELKVTLEPSKELFENITFVTRLIDDLYNQ